MRQAIVFVIVLSCVGQATAAELEAPSPVQNSGRITIIEENDALTPWPQDRHYTQGFRGSYLSAPLQAPDGTSFAFPNFFANGADQVRRYELIVGQSLFTPKNLALTGPNPTDRPYAGWLYVGAGLLQETDRRSLESLEFLAGVVGPSALGRQTQSAFHSVLGQHEPQGWRNQLDDEPGLLLSYERKWRFERALTSTLAIDAIPEISGSVGNVLTYGEIGVLFRIGHGLQADYGPARIRPALSGTAWFDPRYLQDPFGWYLFAGAQLRAVARNIFLDGNTFTDSPSVEKRVLVADLSAGLSLFWSDRIKLDFVMTQRTQEFVGQNGVDRYGGIALSFGLP